MDDSYLPIRVMALHALAYCERLFYLEEVEEIRVADAAVYEGRTLHEKLAHTEEATGDWIRMELSSERLGLVGKIDALRERDGMIIPYEHKKGKPKRGDEQPAAWFPDMVQICAYALLLEEETGKPISEGRVRYHGENVTVRVPIDSALRQRVREMIDRAKALREKQQRPPVTENDSRCLRCSLAPVCLPEEERWNRDASWEPVRLFPPHLEKITIYVTEPGARISRSGDKIKVHSHDGDSHEYPIHTIGSLAVIGYPQITTQALHFLSRNQVAVHWFSPAGRYVSGLVSDTAAVQRRIRQYQALSDPGVCLRLARRLAAAKVEGSLRYVLRATRKVDRESPGIAENIARIRECLSGIARAEGIDSIRGFEGMAGRSYFTILPKLFREDVPEKLRFTKRTRRPPRDPFNALLSFGYSLLYSAVLRGILASGLEPSLGFMHSPRSSAHPLVLDLMELFRVPVWDMMLIGSINRLMWKEDRDFQAMGNKVLLTKEGRSQAIELFENRLDEKWKHPVIGYSLSYGRMMELEARLLEKEWTSEPGLFARMRIR